MRATFALSCSLQEGVCQVSLQDGRVAVKVLTTELSTKNAYADDLSHYVAIYSDAAGYVFQASLFTSSLPGTGQVVAQLNPPLLKCISLAGSAFTSMTSCRGPSQGLTAPGGRSGRTSRPCSSWAALPAPAKWATSLAALGTSSSDGGCGQDPLLLQLLERSFTVPHQTRIRDISPASLSFSEPAPAYRCPSENVVPQAGLWESV